MLRIDFMKLIFWGLMGSRFRILIRLFIYVFKEIIFVRFLILNGLRLLLILIFTFFSTAIFIFSVIFMFLTFNFNLYTFILFLPAFILMC